MKILDLVVIGGGAAGFFGALRAKEKSPSAHIRILEKSQKPLSKVRISGGGRCNVTHGCFEPGELVKFYPRGSTELLGPFHTFSPTETVEWFESRGVPLKQEADGRMFPKSNSSETIIDLFFDEAKRLGVEVELGCGVKKLEGRAGDFRLTLSSGETLRAKKILLATGSAPPGHRLVADLGVDLVPPVPSLFTFNCPSSYLLDLQGVSFEEVKLHVEGIDSRGPLLLTHWGFSGPAALKLSAWAARKLHEKQYHTTLTIDFLPHLSEEEIRLQLKEERQHSKKKVSGFKPFPLPTRFWKELVHQVTKKDPPWSHLSNRDLEGFVRSLKRAEFKVEGKTTYKEEFVTAGGIDLKEVNFKTMELKKVPGIYAAGELLNVDGVTGGFNFQAAWTTSYVAADSAFSSRDQEIMPQTHMPK